MSRKKFNLVPIIILTITPICDKILDLIILSFGMYFYLLNTNLFLKFGYYVTISRQKDKNDNFKNFYDVAALAAIFF